MRPSIGAVIVAKLSCVSALSMPAWSAREVLLVGDELRLVLGALGFGLIEHGGKRALIDDGKRVAFLDLLAFDEIHAGELAVDLAVDGDSV